MPQEVTRTPESLQRRLDELVGNHVVFTIHTGDPGPHCTDNLAFGDGLPQPYSFAEGGSVRFCIPAMPRLRARVPVRRRWWQIWPRHRTEMREQLVRIEAVTMWSNGRPVMPVDLEYSPIVLVSGSVLIVTPSGKPRIWAA